MTPQLDKAVDLKTQSDFYSFEVNESIVTVTTHQVYFQSHVFD